MLSANGCFFYFLFLCSIFWFAIFGFFGRDEESKRWCVRRSSSEAAPLFVSRGLVSSMICSSLFNCLICFMFCLVCLVCEDLIFPMLVYRCAILVLLPLFVNIGVIWSLCCRIAYFLTCSGLDWSFFIVKFVQFV